MRGDWREESHEIPGEIELPAAAVAGGFESEPADGLGGGFPGGDEIDGPEGMGFVGDAIDDELEGLDAEVILGDGAERDESLGGAFLVARRGE